MTSRTPNRSRLAAIGLIPLIGLSLGAPLAIADPAPAKAPAEVLPDTYVGKVQVVEGAAADQKVLVGSVFDDTDQDSEHDSRERGIAGVAVSNGRDVVITDRSGGYRIPAFDNMTVFVTQPAGWTVPVDEDNIAQFSYNHLPAGSPKLKYGGIPATGPLPKAINFPLVKSKTTGAKQQNCPIAADTQPYNLQQMGYARDGAVADLVDRTDYGGCGVLLLGDNVGDDLSLYPALKDIYRDVNGPVRMVPGNHDMDFDANESGHSLDTYRHLVGPAYYSYDVGEAHFVVLDNILYPRAPGATGYEEQLDEEQLAWLAEDLKRVSKDKLIVIAAHAPIVDHRFMMTVNGTALYDLLEGRKAVTIGGHTHTAEKHRPGDRRAEWAKVGIEELQFTQLVAGAVSGDWYSGALDESGLPYSLMAEGSRPGILTLELNGSEFSERYTVRNEPDSVRFSLGLNSPHWRQWAPKALAWRDNGKEGPAPALGDEHLITRDDLAGGSWLTANVYLGSTGTKVEVALDGGDPVAAEHTQPAKGEALRQGWEWADPYGATRNLLSSGSVPRSTPHLWKLPLSEKLAEGTHTARVTVTDDHGRTYTDTIRFTVADRRPAS
ncbi:calcineurin-like phosphoesterase C-terminal domain-containing protein [Microlunatus parietis]|uniref:Calcineurin-like phosphoesterase family protein n=1 Tax=Microlunatus parietis TaxID=682979 RepID=A0A7Y9I8A4_9ACTN|nr:calcineurin-like phosphoesterase family protein [Microlunatus parietis]NYE71826.1 calcineurin-like phosphoesterase family protein [Microlunatus parietis]